MVQIDFSLRLRDRRCHGREVLHVVVRHDDTLKARGPALRFYSFYIYMFIVTHSVHHCYIPCYISSEVVILRVMFLFGLGLEL